MLRIVNLGKVRISSGKITKHYTKLAIYKWIAGFEFFGILIRFIALNTEIRIIFLLIIPGLLFLRVNAIVIVILTVAIAVYFAAIGAAITVNFIKL